MAAATLVPTKVDKWQDSKRVHVTGSMVLAGDYVAGGVLPTWANMAGTTKKPVTASLEAPGYGGRAIYDPTTGKFRFYVAANTEFPVATVPAGASGVAWYFHAIFPTFG